MVTIKWHLHTKQVENKVNLYHDSERWRGLYWKKISKTIMFIMKWHLQSKQVENRVDLYHDNGRDEDSHIESKHIS